MTENNVEMTKLTRTLVGTVTSDKMDKTVTVLVGTSRQAPPVRQVRRREQEVPRSRRDQPVWCG